MKKETKCRVPEGETPITWNQLGFGLFTIIVIGSMIWSVFSLVAILVGDMVLFPTKTELKCDTTRVGFGLGWNTYTYGTIHCSAWFLGDGGSDYNIATSTK